MLDIRFEAKIRLFLIAEKKNYLKYFPYGDQPNTIKEKVGIFGI